MYSGFLHLDKIISYAVILHLSGENSRCLLFTVIPVRGVCLYLLFYDLFFLIGCVGLVGISLASRVTYIFEL